MPDRVAGYDDDLFGDGATDAPVIANNGAVISDDGDYRYRLWREWDSTRSRLAWIMLNPSTADALKDDPTIRRCMGFARAWGYGGITVVNVFAWRATNPDDLAATLDPYGPENDQHLLEAIFGSYGVMAAWGAHEGATEAFGRFLARNPAVDYTALSCLGQTKDGHPRHPLYVASSTPAQPWRLP